MGNEYSAFWDKEISGDNGPYEDVFLATRERLRYVLHGVYPQSYAIMGGISGYSELQVMESAAPDKYVRVAQGAAIVNGREYFNDELRTIGPVADNVSGNARKDLVVVRVDYANQTVRLAIKEGVDDGSETVPSLQEDATYYECALAVISVANGFTTIGNAQIDNSVKTFPQLLSYKDGGTGYQNYSVRHVLQGNSSGGLSKEYLTGFTIRNTTTGSNKSSGSWGTVDFDTLVDPDSLVSLSSNQITFVVGGYYSLDEIVGKMANNSGGGWASGGVGGAMRLRNITQSTTLLKSPRLLNLSAASETVLSWMSGIFQVAANDVCEVQIYIGSGTWRYETASVGGETMDAVQAQFRRLGDG